MSRQAVVETRWRLYGQRGRQQLHGLGLWSAVLVIVLVSGAISPTFLTATNLLNIVQQASVLGIAAVGVTFVMVTGGVDLSVGAVISLSAVVSASVMNGQDANIFVAIAVVLALGLAIGAAHGCLVAYWKLPAFILTLGSAILLTGVTQVYTGGTAAGIVAPGYREVLVERYAGIPALVLVFAAVIAVGLLIQRKTQLGQRLYLVGANPRAARLSGLPVKRTLIAAYAAAGFAAALAGLVLLARSGVSGSYAGRGLEFDVLAAVILGGTTWDGGRGGIGGTVAGVLILVGIFNLLVILGLSTDMQLIVKGLVIVGAASLYTLVRRGQA
jgi:ribose/xylose/arabinose/galactoside ABC-type transport system permease subunit